jgi:hypothetical protein
MLRIVPEVVPVVFLTVPNNQGPKCVANPIRISPCVMAYQSA